MMSLLSVSVSTCADVTSCEDEETEDDIGWFSVVGGSPELFIEFPEPPPLHDVRIKSVAATLSATVGDAKNLRMRHLGQQRKVANIDDNDEKILNESLLHRLMDEANLRRSEHRK
jgi:hypothetical protein